MNTFYMVEMDYTGKHDERAAYDDFYQHHIDMLLTVDGFQGAQRFEATHEARAPFVAIYKVAEPGVMTGPSYTSKAGRNSVAPEFKAKMINWDRNLVQSAEDLEVPMGGWLVLIDRLTDDAPPLPAGFTPLKVVGLDETVKERGAMIGTSGEPSVPKEQKGWIVRHLKPLHARRRP